MASEIRVNSLSSRTGLSTVTFTDTGPIFSGITTFQDNSGFNVGTGGSIFSPASNTVTLGTNSAERLRITSAGDMGLGTASPRSITNFGSFAINGTAGSFTDYFLNGTRTGTTAVDSNGFTSEAVGSSTPFRVITNGSERLRITSDGKIGISDTSPENTLSIKNIGSFEGDANSFYLGSNFTGTGQNFSGSGKHAQRFFFNNASSNGYLKYENTGTTGNAGDAITWQERLRITSGGELKIPAGIGPQITFENQHSHTGDAAISTFDDGVGTLLCLGSNFYFSSGGAETRYNTSEESAGIVINRTGTIDFNTGGTSATATSRLRITSGGHLVVGSGYADFQSGTRGEASSTDPYKLVFQNQYSNGYTDEKLKLYLFNSGNTRQGFGPGPVYDLQYHCSGGAADQARHSFYTDNVLRMQIHDDYGGVTKPTQPGFFTRRAVGGDGRAANVQEWSVTGTSSFNTGNHFNASNGRFTAPVAGKYIFTACPGYKQTSYDYNFKFLVNGGQQSEPVRIIDGGDDLTSHSSFTGTVIYNLNANDYVQVEVGYIHHVNLTYNFFMGYLLG